MAITWTIIVLGVFLPVMASEETTTVVQPTQAGSTPQPESDITTPSTFTTKESSPTSATLEKQTDPTNPTTQPSSTQPQPTTQPKTTNPVTTAESTTQTSTAPLTTQLITTVKEQVTTAVLSLLTSVKSSSPVGPTTTNSNPVTQTSTSSINPSTNPATTVTLHSSADLSKQPTEQITTVPQDSTDSERSKPSGEKNSSESATVSPKNAEPDSTTKLSTTQNLQTTQTAITQRTSVQHSDASRDDKEPDTNSTKNTYKHNYINIDSTSSKESVVHEACKTLLQNLKGNCSATVEVTSKELIIKATINTEEVIPSKIYEPPVQKKEIPVDDSKWMIPDTLIAILASCGALVLILCFFAAYCTYHRRSYRKNQQHLTEELQTVENGYHDNPTLEVMEVQPEMQEKKVALNGEFNDSWIVPIDNLLKEDIPDEEDTHL